jgi:hypothetical protein
MDKQVKPYFYMSSYYSCVCVSTRNCRLDISVDNEFLGTLLVLHNKTRHHTNLSDFKCDSSLKVNAHRRGYVNESLFTKHICLLIS